MNINEDKANSDNEDSNFEKNYYTIEYPGQALERKDSFKKWYSIQSEKIKMKNEFVSKNYNKYEINELYKNEDEEEDILNPSIIFSFISICNNCQCYSIHCLKTNSVFGKCLKCEKEYCVGCSVEKYSSDNTKFCIKGYYKSLYLRMKFNNEKELNFDIMEYIFLFLITILIIPIYIPLMSCSSFFNRHPIKPINEKNVKIKPFFEFYKIFFPVLYSLLYFVYIINFLPILFIIAIIIFSLPFLRNKFLIVYEPIMR